MFALSENRLESEDRIIKALMRANLLDKDKRELSWTELLEQTKLSRRSLSIRLRSMEKSGLVRRRVDTSSGEYPPHVYYRLVQTDSKVSKILEQHKAYDRSVEKELTFDENPEEFIKKLSNKASPILLYTLLKGLASKSDRALDDTLENLRFTLKKYLVYRQPFDISDPKALGQKFREIDANPDSFKSDLDSLLAILKQSLPDETRAIDKVYAQPRRQRVDRGPTLNPRGRPKKPKVEVGETE
jgi:DNA-binding HxlR family transcriptional regulator